MGEKKVLTSLDIAKRLIDELYHDHSVSNSKILEVYWKKYLDQYSGNNSLNGKVFEHLIALSLIRQGIFPFYNQAKVAFIPGIDYDFLIYTSNGPIVISAKTSLRERWKQADLEAFVLRNIHRNALSYVVSLDETEVATRKASMSSVMALNGFILATTTEYDDLLKKIASMEPKEAPEALYPTHLFCNKYYNLRE